MNQRALFQSEVKRVLKPTFAAADFQGSGVTYRRLAGAVIHVVKIQGSIYGGQCCVCLGIHLGFLPTATGEACIAHKITEPECEFRTRLAPPGPSDCWWNYGLTASDAHTSAQSILQLYQAVGAPYFQRFSNFPDDFVQVTPAMLASGGLLPFPGSFSPARRALALSRIALHVGRIDEARRFAEFGLENVGGAVLLKSEFQKVLALP